ncbi:MAG: transglycosylase domain-containing protein [Nostocoides sp.]
MNGSARNVEHVLKMLGGFLILSVLVGVLAAGLAMPAVGAFGSTVNGSVQVFNDLPDDLVQNPLNQQSKILDASGKVIATPYAENRIIVPLDQVSPIMQKAQLAIEDNRFYEHGGLDVRGLTRALISNLQGDKQGASTLTQQYVRLTLQENALNRDDQEAAAAAGARNGVEGLARKLRELKMSVELEQRMTKDEILSGYLNIAYYGDQAYGVEAAAEHYFSIPASKLNYVQAALLAGTVQIPSETDPVNYPEAAFHRRNVVLDRMAQLNVITDKQAADGKKIPIKKMLKVQQPKNTCQRSPEPYFCQYVMLWLQRQPGLGKTPAERLRLINTGGLTIQTTLKPALSAKMLGLLKAKVPIGDKSGVGAAATVIEPGTGKVLGMAQTTKFTGSGPGVTEVNWNVDIQDGGTTGQQFGSTAKMFALADALASGIPINSSVFAKKASASTAAEYYSQDNADSCGWSGAWNVRNDFPAGGGPIPLSKATAQSINTAFASLVMKLGVCNVRDTMTTMGLHRGNGDEILPYPAAVTLGGDEVTPMTLAAAYATVAAEGRYCTPIPVVSVTGPDKKKYPVSGANCKQAIGKDVAAGVSALLKGPLAGGGTAAGNQLSGRPAAGKTGTTDDHVESLFVGYTPQLSTAVWVGTPNSQKKMNNITIGGQYYGQVFGSTIAAPLWKKIMDYASSGMPVENFPSPSAKITNGDRVSVPNVSGMGYDAAAAMLRNAGFTAYRAGTVDSGMAAGLVVYSAPSGMALRGAPIGLYVSTGVAPKPKPTATATATATPAAKPTKKPGTKPTNKPGG